MAFNYAKVRTAYNGLLLQKEFLDGLITGHQANGNALIPAHIQIEKVKQVLQYVEEGVLYFQKECLEVDGSVKKFKWWSIPSWKHLIKVFNYYEQLLEKIADLYLGDESKENLA